MSNRFRIVYIVYCKGFSIKPVILPMDESIFAFIVYKTSKYYARIMLHHGRIPVLFCFVFSPFVPWDDRISATFPINKITPWKLYLHCIFKFKFQYIKMLIILSALHGVIQIEYNIIS